MTLLAPTLEAFFTTRLTGQLGASTHTIAAYRDTWRLLLRFAAEDTGTPPHALDLAQLDADLITRFLNHLEGERGNSTTTRNARLAAVHSVFAYAAVEHPEHAGSINRVLAIPAKRRQRRTDITYLTEPEVTALLGAPDQDTKAGRRDHALIQVGITTGLRVSELTGLRWRDVHLGTGAHVLAHGKGRKDRSTPLDQDTVKVLQALAEATGCDADAFVLTTRTGTRMSRDAVAARLTLHAQTAATACPSLTNKTITPHVLRHTAAMRLLASGIDSTVIALWLGHESIDTTQVYLHADLATKEDALARTAPTGTPTGRYHPPEDALLTFLQNL
ncbi:tyrosine-type recombinase/integrase [Ornithinicoccus hortensis]|uniref:Site-specific recombinase XerD n=1 Tax=Ornithinicoccus hortensis TaxID=82346 RepID=A0A542YLI8_9MICO|nr:tyrosine-type recombinase/integrase [Ornithinicoccus hortensis]TQL48948.1 site-specific recombinase XerD [Ornithinicoccus hortensis]